LVHKQVKQVGWKMESPMSRMFLYWLLGCSVVAATTLSGAERDPQVETLLPGVTLTLVAEHPQLATPTGIEVDQAGHVWVVASHTHFRPDDYTGPEQDEVLVFDQTGQRHVFYNATSHTMDLELGPEGWVYLVERDRVLRVKDTDGDGQGDLEETLLKLATEAIYPHNGLSGLAWLSSGSDLLVGLGENFAKPWSLTGPDGAVISGTGEGGMFACHADGTGLRRVAQGLWNPFGVCVRQDGTIIAVDNDPGERPPCRLLHIVEGGDYGYQRAYGSAAHHPFVCWNGELRGTLPMIHPSGEAPCGVTPCGRGVIVSSWSDHRVYFYALQPQGASFGAKRFELVRGSRYFRPTGIAADRSQGSAGNHTWYFADWVDGRYEVHGYGRLWKLEIDLQQAGWVGLTDLEPVTAEAALAADLRHGRRQYSLDKLLKLSRDEDLFIAQAALSALARQAPTWQLDEIQKLAARDRVQAVVALRIAARAEGSPLKADLWIPQFLADENVEVQFETLRWISEARLTAYLATVEQILKRSETGYRLFEAAIATWNTLSGHPEEGVRNLKMLLERVQDRSSSPSLRAYALRLLPERPLTATESETNAGNTFPEGLTVLLLEELLAVGDPVLSLEEVRTLAENPVVGESLLAKLAADSSRSAAERAEAILGLAAVASAQLDLLIQLAGDDNQTLREEALRALRGSTLSAEQKQSLLVIAAAHPESANLAKVVWDGKLLTSGRPALTDTAAWLEKIEAIPGTADIESGRRIFHHPRLAKCSSCHRHRGRGNVVGPDLSRVGAQHDRKWLLQSVLQPSLQMGPEYRPTVIVLEDGRSYTGIRLLSATYEALRDNNGQRRIFQRSEIESIRELDQSFMPEGLVYTLTDRELRDLLAFLETPEEK